MGLWFGYSIAVLQWGDYRTGFAAYEACPQSIQASRVLRQLSGIPLWGGQSLDGKTVLIWTEQGYGDAIQFIRYAPLLAKTAQVIVLCPPALKRLFSTLEGVESVIDSYDDIGNIGNIAYHVPIESLPYRFQTTTETVPVEPYLKPPTASNIRLRGTECLPLAEALPLAARLFFGGNLKVGLVWSGRVDTV